MHSSGQLESPDERARLVPDVTWASEDYIHSLLEDFPFLREAPFIPLSSQDDLCIFRSGDRVLCYYPESDQVYFLGNSMEHAERTFVHVSESGWASALRRVDQRSGKVQDDCWGVAGEIIKISK